MDLYKRHLFYWRLFHWPAEMFLKMKFGYKYEKAKGLPEV